MINAIYKSVVSAYTHINNTLNIISNKSMIVKTWIAVSTFLSAFFLPIQFVILFTFCMIIMDMYYGIKASVKLHKKIESCKSWKGTIRKMKDAFVLLCSMRGVEYFIINEWIDTKVLTCGTALLISLTEIWSILENLNTIDPTGPWKLVGKFLRKKSEEYTGIDIDLEECKTT